MATVIADDIFIDTEEKPARRGHGDSFFSADKKNLRHFLFCFFFCLFVDEDGHGKDYFSDKSTQVFSLDGLLNRLEVVASRAAIRIWITHLEGDPARRPKENFLAALDVESGISPGDVSWDNDDDILTLLSLTDHEPRSSFPRKNAAE